MKIKIKNKKKENKLKFVSSGRKKVSGCGVKLRLKEAFCRRASKKLYFCENCSNQSVKKLETGIWHCKKCGIVSSGNAYSY